MGEERKIYNHTADAYSGLYSLHKYWSKKPYNIVSSLIKKNSKKGENILDPFSGSGVTVLESLLCKRKVIGIDINPASIFITEQLVSTCDIKSVEETFKSIQHAIKESINSIYTIKRGKISFVATHFLWNGNILKEVWYKTNKTIKEEPTRLDKSKIKTFEKHILSKKFMDDKLFENSRINIGKNETVQDLFTSRNMYALSLLMNEIEKIKNNQVRDIMKFCFTSCLGQTSKMVFVIKRQISKKTGNKIMRKNKSVGSWVVGYWRPAEFFEINVWNCFETKLNKFIKVRKNVNNTKLVDVNRYNRISELLTAQCGYSLINKPAQLFLKKIPSNSIDYIITDPPHGNRIPYLELSQMWNSWLNKPVNYQDEIIISTAKLRDKGAKSYNRQLNSVFKELYRVLKPTKKFTLMFNSLDDETWINVITKLNTIGFALRKIETLSYSSNSVVQNNRDAGLKTDFVLTYEKTNSENKKIYLLNGELGKKSMKEYIDFITKSEGHLEMYEVLNKLFFKFLKNNQFFRLSDAIQIMNN